MPKDYDQRVLVVNDESYDERVLVVNGDVINTAAASDGNFLVRQGGLWVPRNIVDADIPASIARDAEVTAAVAAEAATRAAADTSEATARANADTAEASARATADALLLAKASNLSDVASYAAALSNLGGWPAYLHGGGYYYPTFPSALTSAALQTANRLLATPFIVPRDVTIVSMAGEVTVIGDAGRAVADMVTNGTTTVTSATAAFVSTDQGRLVTGTNIPNNTYISSVTNGTTAVLTQAATGSGSGGSLTISGCVVRLGIYADDGTGFPGARVFDSAVVGTANTGGAAQFANAGVLDGHTVAVQEVTVNQALTRGNYWAVSVAQGVTSVAPTMRTLGSVGGMHIPTGSTLPSANLIATMLQQASITLALPPSYTSTPTSGTGPARLFVKIQ